MTKERLANELRISVRARVPCWHGIAKLNIALVIR